MTWKTHMLGGLLAGAAIVYIFDPVLDIQQDCVNVICTSLFTASSTITALLTDLDEKNSKAGQILSVIPAILTLMKFVLFLIGLFTFGKTRKKLKQIRKSLNHRGLLHWLITWAVLSLIVLVTDVLIFSNMSSHQSMPMFTVSFISGFIPGYLSHILLDLISGHIQLLAPFSRKWYGIKIVKEDSALEPYLVRPVLAAASIYVLFLSV